jgi:hypothetical protein
MKNIPTDLNILETIYNHYYDEFQSYDKNNKKRVSKTYVPIDIHLIADQLQVDPEIIFGRLAMHLNKKYGYKNDNGSETPFFASVYSSDKNAINFPLLSSVMATLNDERRRQSQSFRISIVAIIISIIALSFNGFQIWSKFKDTKTQFDTLKQTQK